jgi:glycosyltransferase involved in cell wall biosynthesis
MENEYSCHIYVNKDGIDSESGGLGIWFRSQAIQSIRLKKKVVIFSSKKQRLDEFEQIPIEFAVPSRLVEMCLRLLGANQVQRAFGKFGWDSEDFADKVFGSSANLYVWKNYSMKRNFTRITVPLYGGLGSYLSARFKVEIALVSSTRDSIVEMNIPKKRLRRHYQKVIRREEKSLSKHTRRVSVSRSIHLRYGLPHNAQSFRIDMPRVYDPFDIDEMHGLKTSKLEFLARANTILFIGRCENRKGFDYLLEIWKDLLVKFPTLKLVLVGDEIYNQKMAVLDLQNVVCLGLVSDIMKSKLLSQAKVVLIPSRYESFGIVTIEAMSFGTPIVVSSVGGLKGISDLSPAVEACDVGDTKAFVTKAALLLSDKMVWDEHSRELRMDFLRYYKMSRLN